MAKDPINILLVDDQPPKLVGYEAIAYPGPCERIEFGFGECKGGLSPACFGIVK